MNDIEKQENKDHAFIEFSQRYGESWRDDEQLKQLYRTHMSQIKDQEIQCRRTRTYLCYLNDQQSTLINNMQTVIKEIYHYQSHAFKINLSFSFILQHCETLEYRYFYASNNEQLLISPRLISNQCDLQNLLNDLAAKDSPSLLKEQRLNTKWVIERIVNLCLHLVMTTYPLECYMDWFPSLICKNYIFKHFVKTVEPTSLKFCTIIELITLHLEYTTAQVKYANFSYAHAQTFVLLNGEMATVSTGFRKLKFWLWLLWTVFYLTQTGF